MEQVREFLDRNLGWLNVTLFELGDRSVTLGTILYLLLSLVALILVSRWTRGWVANRLLGRSRLDQGMRHAIGTIVRYLVLAIGFIVILQTAGIDLTTLNVLAGAVGIGVGLGLQNVANNFISGLIILFERPIKVGDRIEVDDVNGLVTAINTRSTTVVTNDNIAIIIPNAKLITENVINWSYTDDKVRMRVPVGVSYSSDVELVTRLLIEAAAADPDVLTDPSPEVRFLGFGDSSLDFELLVWTSSHIHRPLALKSTLYYYIFARFRAEGVEIPFPQRDVHVRTIPERWSPARPDDEG